MHMTPEIAEQNAIDQLRLDAQKLTDEAAMRQQTLNDQIAAGEGELPGSGEPKEKEKEKEHKDDKEEKPSKM